MSRQNQAQMLLSKWWVRALMAIVFALITYGFASLAINSGSLLEYAATIFFFILTLKSAARSIRFALNH